MEKIIALVPMRHHSQRVPGKNFRHIAGKPLFAHIIETLLSCPEIKLVVVDTDSPPVIDELRKNYPEVRIIERPGFLKADDVPMNEILAYDTSQVQADFYLQTHSTNPLLNPETISRAVKVFQENWPVYDSLFTVTRLQNRLWDQLGRAINHNPAVLLQTQDLPPVFEENSCLYIFTREIILRRRNRLGERPFMFEISAQEAWDIDNELDFSIVKHLMEMRQAENLQE
jgi:CMP-N-acetylneuraminic acid synthetase